MGCKTKSTQRPKDLNIYLKQRRERVETKEISIYLENLIVMQRGIVVEKENSKTKDPGMNLER